MGGFAIKHDRPQTVSALGVALVAIVIATQTSCVPIAVGAAISTHQDTQQAELIRRAYIVHRQADGIPIDQIKAEILRIDPEWAADLALSGGDLLASTQPYQREMRSCERLRQSAAQNKCQALRAEHKPLLEAAGLSFE
jgi:hypothetical protein